ncbi:nitric oxide synthase-interacting protein isoform X2 [Lepisosteus oculatus]|uniref:nitric oxide synthase-interacting protein isoform X2 n=1 Tax=Lepisosteus oculatus TaxID=7918 RepID=UPI00073FD3D1|nr:PREDICTED: nitric oxide synthase-interacting protein isoform X1 [Lepisosteus oculatus]
MSLGCVADLSARFLGLFCITVFTEVTRQVTMTRHGKNCTAGAVYTYHEKKKDTAASGYGTQSVRLGKDAIKDFDCCCLSLQPCRDPVVTPDGYLYEREAILEYILHQKTEIAKKMKAYEKQKRAQASEEKLLSRASEDSKVKSFLQKEGSIVSKPLNPFSSGQSAGESSSSNRASNSATSSSALPSFWIPCLTPEAKPTTLKKPVKTVLCPMSGRPLKLSDLVSVRFTPLDPALDRVALLTRQDRYVCAVTHDTLGNSVPCAVLRPSGAVVTVECVEKLIRKDMTDPVSGAKLTEKDIIVLQRGGTGFSASGVALQAKESRPVMQV